MLAALAAAGLVVITVSDLPEQGLAVYQWEKRPVLVFSPPDDPRLEEQLTLFAGSAADMIERRNVVVIDETESSPLRDRFAPGGFTVILVGLDGGEKFRRDEVVSPHRLEDLIDGMPMRRREMRDG